MPCQAAFEYEASMCSRLHHRNIDRLVGQVAAAPAWLVFEVRASKQRPAAAVHSAVVGRLHA